MTVPPNPALDAVLARLGALHPKVIDLALDRVLRLLADLGDPHLRLPPVVHVAGTNGKGSTIAILRAIAEAAGLSVHVYTSPHLVRFAERIRVAGRIIDEGVLTDLLERVERSDAGQSITFFEATTAAAFLAFAETPADLCLLETGMGGRLDATNVVPRPALTLLAPISMDHEDYLGHTLAAIAAEKAGILKPGVACLSAAQTDEAMAVIAARAAALEAPLLVAGRDWSATAEGSDAMTFAMAGTRLSLPRPSLPGLHQIGNAALAIAAARTLAGRHGLPTALGEDAALAGALRAIDWPARLQRLDRGRLAARLPDGWELWLDGGHNPGAGRVLADAIAGWRDRPLDLVVGMLTTKDSVRFLEPLAPFVRRVRTVAVPGEALSRDGAETAILARRAGCPDVAPAADVAAALADLTRRPGPARVLICGSLYLAGTVLADNG